MSEREHDEWLVALVARAIRKIEEQGVPDFDDIACAVLDAINASGRAWVRRRCSNESCTREPSKSYVTCDACRKRALAYYHANKEARNAYNKRWQAKNYGYRAQSSPNPRPAP